VVCLVTSPDGVVHLLQPWLFHGVVADVFPMTVWTGDLGDAFETRTLR